MRLIEESLEELRRREGTELGGGESMEDVLVLSVEGGRDIFIPVNVKL